jgi:RNA polymerase sigma factor (sigma-70 family)
VISLEEKDLIERIREGDKDSFVYIVDLYKKQLIMFCYSYVKDLQEAEDISQEVFLKFYQNISKYRCECSLKTYLFYIARSTCIDFLRRKKLKEVLNGFNIFKSKDSSFNEDKLYIKEAILNLPESLRTVIVLYYYAGLSEKEIKDVLNISERAVEGRLYRARQKLREEFQKGEGVLCRKETT